MRLHKKLVTHSDFKALHMKGGRKKMRGLRQIEKMSDEAQQV